MSFLWLSLTEWVTCDMQKQSHKLQTHIRLVFNDKIRTWWWTWCYFGNVFFFGLSWVSLLRFWLTLKIFKINGNDRLEIGLGLNFLQIGIVDISTSLHCLYMQLFLFVAFLHGPSYCLKSLHKFLSVWFLLRQYLSTCLWTGSTVS